MRQKTEVTKPSAEKVIKDIRRITRNQYGAEEKIRIVLDGLRGEESIAALCRREGIAESLYYNWSKEFLEAGKKRLAGDTARAATTEEVKVLRREARDLKEVVAYACFSIFTRIGGALSSLAARCLANISPSTRLCASARSPAPAESPAIIAFAIRTCCSTIVLASKNKESSERMYILTWDSIRAYWAISRLFPARETISLWNLKSASSILVQDPAAHCFSRFESVLFITNAACGFIF